MLNTTVTFATSGSSPAGLKETIPAGHPKYKSVIIKSDCEVCGFCYLLQYRKRAAYNRTAEISVYLKPWFTGKGTGTQTLEKLKTVALENGIRVLLGVITAENLESVRLFEKCGFEKCAHLRKVGEK